MYAGANLEHDKSIAPYIKIKYRINLLMYGFVFEWEHLAEKDQKDRLLTSDFAVSE